MMLMGLGHDVVDINAFAEQMAEPGTRMRGLFSARELHQYTQRARLKHDDESVHLAARWAGKEAVMKAWCEAIAQLPHGSQGANAGEGGSVAGAYPYTLDDFPWREVEILDDSRGCPRVAPSAGVLRAVCRSLGLTDAEGDGRPKPVFHVSLSHDGPVASAVAILRVDG
ncbi:4'-phosphopantetheinyl transferase [Bifidobacterium sp. DSM 109960]|uniref:Holo-[acyl-carrier-protein] synthase n=1 Tax=Bifidobacterium erythrocebi TaxID=2675325 RepID=A0A7Y0ES41_9BIFI|nr:holo-ACP synthase [Bifidobacterium sp. DSM 109960]NMM95406.1 4'-phosphopantetheinyl transferase [Bifidobacterium sp. DSM 109960]